MSAADNQRTSTSKDCNAVKMYAVDNKIKEVPGFEKIDTYAAPGTLTRSWPGIVYQLNHLTFTLHCALKQKDPFLYLATEMIAAGKLDDIVLQYKNDKGKQVGRFVQIKHRSEQYKTISAAQLLEANGDFSIPKYFTSWQVGKTNELFSKIEYRHIILCTDIGVDLDDLEKNKIVYEEVGDPDKLFELKSRVKKTAWYKLKADKESNEKLYDRLRQTSDTCRLAKQIAKCVYSKQSMKLEMGNFQDYHRALVEYVFHTNPATLRDEFIRNNGLSQGVERFRKTFLSEFKKLAESSGNNYSEEDLWEEIKKKFKAQRFRKDFGRQLTVPPYPQMTNLVELSDHFVKLLTNATDYVVKIVKTASKKEGATQPINVIVENIDKMAGHVLIKNEDKSKVIFNPKFLKDGEPLAGNIGEFRTALKNQVGKKYQLELFEFDIEKYETCTEREFLTKSKLPDDDIDDKDISNFLGEFTLAVNQPDSGELDDIMGREIVDNKWFNRLQSELMARTLKMNIFEWYSGRGKEGSKMKYLSHKECQEFLDVINCEISSFATSGIILIYCEKMRVYDVRFKSEVKEIKDFLDMNGPFSPSSRIMQLVANSEETLPLALRTYYTLQGVPKYTKEGSFIFIDLDTLILPTIMERVKTSFAAPDYPDLLLVDFESKSAEQYLLVLWNLFSEILGNHVNKKMILITRKGTYSANSEIAHQIRNEKSGESSFGNLANEAQQKLLWKPIIRFQGQDKRTNFAGLLGFDNFGNIGVEESKNLEQIIDTNTLVQLIRDEEIRIGGEVEQLGTIQDYYIPRTINRHVVIKKDVLKASGTTDLFAIGGIGRKALGKLLPNKGRLRSFDDNSQMKPHLSEYIILSNGREADQFKTLCERNSNRNIHWLQVTSTELIWIQSFGDITNLVAHKKVISCDNDKDTLGATYSKEDGLVDYDEQWEIVILSDIAEMLRSTVLTLLKKKKKYNESNLLVLQIKSTENFIWMRSFRNITNSLAREDVCGCNYFEDRPGAISLTEEKLVEHDERRRIVILSDIAGSGKSTVLTQLARKMKHNESSLLVIRINLTMHTTMLAEEKANQTFNSNNTDAAVDFLVDKLLRPSTDLESQVYKVIIKDKRKAALLFDGFDEISPIYENTVIDLLQALAKLDIKKLVVTTRPHVSKILEEKLGIFSHTLQPFSTKDQMEFLKKNWKKKSSRNGSHETSEEDPEMHAARVMNLLAKSLGHRMTEFTSIPLQTMMVAEIAKQQLFDATEVTTDLENGEPKLLQKVDMIDWYKQFVDYKYNCYTEKKRSDQTNIAEIKDSRDMRQIMTITHKKLALDALFDKHTVEVLLNSQPDIVALYKLFRDENLGEERIGFITQVVNREPQFIHCSFAEYFAATFLIDTLKDDSRNHQVRNFFVAELFVKSRYKNIRAFLNCLLSPGANAPKNGSWTSDLRENCETVYHVAAKEGNVNIVTFFLNICGQQCDNQTLRNTKRLDRENLNEAESSGEYGDQGSDSSNMDGVLSLIEYLPKPKAAANLEDEFDATPLIIAVDNTDKYSCSCPPFFMKNEYLDVVKCLVKGGANINCTHSNGETPLHIAAKKPYDLLLDAVKYLVKNMANIHSKDNNGHTPLYTAAVAGNVSLVEYLIKKGADVDSQENYGWTALRAAVEKDDLEIVESLVQHRADVNLPAHNGTTPLHRAVELGSCGIVTFLLSNGARIDSHNKYGHRAWDIATMSNNLIVKNCFMSEYPYLKYHV